MRKALLALFIVAICAEDIAAQYLPNLSAQNYALPDLLQTIQKRQGRQAASKATGQRERLTGVSFRALSGVMLLDSLSYQYNSHRGAEVKNEQLYSYYDYSMMQLFIGRENPSKSVLGYDTGFHIIHQSNGKHIVYNSRKTYNSGHLDKYIMTVDQQGLKYQFKWTYNYDSQFRFTDLDEMKDTTPNLSGGYKLVYKVYLSYKNGLVQMDSGYNFEDPSGPRVQNWYLYDLSGNMLTWDRYVRHNGGSEARTRFTMTYDALNRMESIVEAWLNPATNTLEDGTRYLYSYQGASLTETSYDVLEYNNFDSVWYGRYKEIVRHNSLGDPAERMTFFPANQGWDSFQTFTYTYTSAGHYDRITKFSYSNNERWTEYEMYTFRYEAYSDNVSISTFATSFRTVLLSPNPSDNKVRLTFKRLPSRAPVVSIYSLNGQLVYHKTIPISSTADIDVSGLSPGTYLVTIDCGAHERQHSKLMISR